MTQPNIHPTARLMTGAIAVGNVTMGPQSSLWCNAVARGDIGPITIGARSNVQDNSVLHLDEDFPLFIGDDVTVGHACILHGCTLGNGVLVGMGSVIMSGAFIGEKSIIGAGSLVTQGTRVPPGHLPFGRPAKVVRPLTPQEMEHNIAHAAAYAALAAKQPV